MNEQVLATELSGGAELMDFHRQIVAIPGVKVIRGDEIIVDGNLAIVQQKINQIAPGVLTAREASERGSQ